MPKDVTFGASAALVMVVVALRGITDHVSVEATLSMAQAGA